MPSGVSAPAEFVASVGQPTPEHVASSLRLLESLPVRLRQALRSAPQAEQVLFALGGFSEPSGELGALVESIARQQMLALAELALPAVKAQAQPQRDRFLAEFALRVERDARVTLREFVLLTLLRQRLREAAGLPIATRYRRMAEIADDVRMLLSLMARLSDDASGKAFAAGARVLGLGWDAPPAGERLTLANVSASLERLRLLAPLAKPALLRACVEVAMADGRLRIAEAELLRAIAATLDCPVPPVLAAQDPLLLAA